MSKKVEKTQVIEAAEIVEAPKAAPEAPYVSAKPARRWNIGGIFWGLLLVLIGILLLLDSLGVIEVDFSNIWRLWPVLIIGAGLSMLSLKGWLGGVVSFVAALALLALIAFAIVDNPWNSDIRSPGVQTLTETATVDSAKKLDITVNAGASTINLTSSKDEKGVKATQESNGFDLVKSAETKGDTRFVGFESKSPNGIWIGNAKSTMRVAITQDLPVALKINTGAAKVTGDLSQARITSLNIEVGASSIDLRLGAREARQNVRIKAGASGIVLYIPKNVGVRVESDGGLSTTTVEDAAKLDGSVYESTNFSSAEKQITIRAETGVSKFEVKRY